MSYQIEKTSQGHDIVINGFEKGIASSPYMGIGNIRNMNTSYYPGVAYTNYKRQAATLSGGFWYAGTHSTDVSGNQNWEFTAEVTPPTMGTPLHKAVSPAGYIYILDSNGVIWKQTSPNSTTFNVLEGGTGRLGDGHDGLAYWNNYLVVFGDGLIEFCGLGTDDSAVISSNWNVLNNNSVTVALGAAVSTTLLRYNGTYGDVYLNENDPVQFTTTGTLPTPLATGTTYYIVAPNVDPENGTTFEVSATVGGSPITFTVTGSGTHTITDYANPLPIGNIDTFAFTITPSSSITTGTITSYVSPTGQTITGVWQGATGQYNIVDPLGNNVLTTFTNGSNTIEFISPLAVFPAGTYTVKILSNDATTNRAWVSKVDGNLYFANGRGVGRILAQNENYEFNPSRAVTYVVDYAVVELLDPNDIVSDIVDLKSTQVISGKLNTYTWDYVSSNVTAPSPVGEQIFAMINLLNNIYILAGQKGNIYISNGYSAQLYRKLPDFIAGVIDPVWSFGDLMVHRSKLFFQVLAKNTSGTNILAGIFSLIVSPAADGELASGLVMESQNSGGLTPSSGAVGNGVLVDNSPSANGNDSYYSAYSSGSSTGTIDYNNTTPWSNDEPVIETDIIPIGTFLDKKTFGNAEFKLDRPLVTGDSISLYWRPSLTDSYTLIGTTTTAQLSDVFPTTIYQSQWAQFKVTTKCASSGSSFVPIREIRLHYN